jgi:glycosyltransferase involved in cell wall biosynthesis
MSDPGNLSPSRGRPQTAAWDDVDVDAPADGCRAIDIESRLPVNRQMSEDRSPGAEAVAGPGEPAAPDGPGPEPEAQEQPAAPAEPAPPRPAPASRPPGPSADHRSTLAFIEGFQRPRDNQAHGTFQAAYLICQALAEQDHYTALHLYRDGQRRPTVESELAVPAAPPTTVFDKLLLHSSRERYAAIYVANGEQILTAPHLLRPPLDWAPVICSVGTAHANQQWSNLLLSLASGAVRPTDGFIFKSQAAQGLFRRTLDDWSARFGLPGPALGETAVIPNGVDVEANKRSPALREETRRRLRLDDRDLVFLTFSRLSPGTKGDLQALVVRWKEVVERLPHALLVLSGAVVERSFVADLRLLARAAGVSERVLILDNPFEVAPNARGRLMSAADVFVHLSTGIEETSPLVVHEAMAHGLPVITSAWAGLPEIVTPGETGFLLETRAAPVAPYIAATLFGQSDRTHLLYASKVVTCDFAGFVGAAQALGYEERRRRMGAAARRRAEAHAIGRIARRYVEFFEATARAAERAWTGPPPTRPLVDLDAAIAAQASRPLALADQVRLGETGRARLVTLGLHPEPAARLEQVLAAFEGRDRLSVAELAAAAARPAPRSAGDHDDLAATSRFLVRLLNLGVIELC